jgi:hypothetical protein
MYRKVWDNCQSSVCSIHFLSRSGTRITTFTGFKANNFLITDAVINKFALPSEVMIRFTRTDGCTELASKILTYADFKARIISKKWANHPGYAIINLDFDEFRDIPSLKCSKKIDFQIGHPIAVLGYQLEQDNLAIKSGIISSFYREVDGLNYIQVDCSITQGNTGSPLIDAETLEVIGVIGHRLAFIARAYKDMMRIINHNLKILKEAEGKLNLNDIDPVQVLIVNQNQIKHLVNEFFKSVNLRVGFAVELCSLIDLFAEAEDMTSADLEQRLDD